MAHTYTYVAIKRKAIKKNRKYTKQKWGKEMKKKKTYILVKTLIYVNICGIH